MSQLVTGHFSSTVAMVDLVMFTWSDQLDGRLTPGLQASSLQESLLKMYIISMNFIS
jgi:hypothetical protein